MIDTKKIILFTPGFFCRQFFATIQLSEVKNMLLKRASILKTTRSFSGGVIGNFFEDIFVLSIKISTSYGHPAPKA
jgi:hypothetical protein